MRRFLQVVTLACGLLISLSGLAWQDITIKHADTLSSVAEKYRPHGVSSADMVIAIRNVNPALKGKGVLQLGMHLHLPTTSSEVRKALSRSIKSSKPAQHFSATGKTNTNTKIASATKLSSDQITLISLQQTIANQNQAIQAYQAQVAALSKSNSVENVSHGLFSATSIFAALWIVTLIFFVRARRAVRNQSALPRLLAPSKSEPLFAVPPEAHDSVSSFEKSLPPDLPLDPDPKWEQVELDIPESLEPVQANIHLEPSLSYEEQAELVGEQQNIIKAIKNDHDNIEWHRALLEFYVKTNNESGFNRHFQNMLNSELMVESDPLWEEVRKMYLNQWIYQKED